MAISDNVINYLKGENIPFEIAGHPLAYTATEVASSQHVPGKKMIKSIIVKVNKVFIMCVLPAIHLLDFQKLEKVLNAKGLKLAEEKELKKLFPEYHMGAEPPFGHLYGLKVYSDKILETGDEIVFNAGTHTDVIKMKYQDFKHLVQPVVAEIGTHI